MHNDLFLIILSIVCLFLWHGFEVLGDYYQSLHFDLVATKGSPTIRLYLRPAIFLLRSFYAIHPAILENGWQWIELFRLLSQSLFYLLMSLMCLLVLQ